MRTTLYDGRIRCFSCDISDYKHVINGCNVFKVFDFTYASLIDFQPKYRFINFPLNSVLFYSGL